MKVETMIGRVKYRDLWPLMTAAGGEAVTVRFTDGRVRTGRVTYATFRRRSTETRSLLRRIGWRVLVQMAGSA